MLANGVNANDTDAVSTFVNNLSASIVQKKLDKATKQDVTDGIAGKWISSELFKSNNEVIDAKKANVEDVTALSETVAALAADLGSGGQNCRIAWGSYTGNNSVGPNHPSSLTFDFMPVWVWIIGYNASSSNVYVANLLRPSLRGAGPDGYLSTAWSDRGVSWYAPASTYGDQGITQMNKLSYTYWYVAIGVAV